MGMLHHIFKNGWEDKEYIQARVYGMDKVREEAAKWTPEEVERVTGMKEAEVRDVAETMAKNRPSTIVWAMGQTQHTNGNAIVRASCILQLALGQRRRLRRRHATSTAATTTCRARPTSARTPIRCRATTASRPARGSTGRRSGASTTSGSRSSSSTRR